MKQILNSKMNNTQSKNKTLILIIVLLLLSNIFLLGFYIFSHKEPPRRERGKDVFITSLKNEVGFSEGQLKKFTELKETDWAEAKKKMEDIRQIKWRLFDLTRQSNIQDSTVEKLADSIAILQKEVEIKSFQHFKKTRAICTPTQQAAYDSLMKKIITRFGRKPRSEK